MVGMKESLIAVVAVYFLQPLALSNQRKLNMFYHFPRETGDTHLHVVGQFLKPRPFLEAIKFRESNLLG